MKSGFLFVVLILSKVAVSLSVRGRLPATSHIVCRSIAFHIFNGVSLKSLLISPYLKPVYLSSGGGPSRLLYSSLNRKLRIDIPFQLLTKRMKDFGAKTLSMETLRKLLYGLRTISTGKIVVGLSTY